MDGAYPTPPDTICQEHGRRVLAAGASLLLGHEGIVDLGGAAGGWAVADACPIMLEGGTLLDRSELHVDHLWMADPEGNDFCIV